MKKYILTLFFLTFAFNVYCMEKEGANFLNIGIGARAFALNGAFTAIENDLDNTYWNPAGLARIKHKEIGFAYSNWLLGMRHQSLNGVFPSNIGVLGMDFIRLSQPSLEQRSLNREYAGEFQSYSQSFGVILSRNIYNDISGGLKFKFIQSKIAEDSASTFAFDIGGLYKMKSRPLLLGFAVKNIGPGLKFINQRDKLPLTVSIGAVYTLISSLNLSLDIKRRIYANKTIFSVGSEYQFMPSMVLRSGYLIEQNYKEPDNYPANFSGGIGFIISNYKIDYAFSPAGEFGNIHILSLKVKI